MPLARHDGGFFHAIPLHCVSTHMPLARHDQFGIYSAAFNKVSTHMPLARHDHKTLTILHVNARFYSHASCEA